MNMIKTSATYRSPDFISSFTAPKQGVVVLVSDNPATVKTMQPVCDFLDLRAAVASSPSDLISLLQDEQPMAVISMVEGTQQDGFYTMKLVADYRRDLPVFILTEGDPVLEGAADAVQEMYGLTSVAHSSGGALAGELVSFLFAAGRRAGCMRLVPV